MNLFISSCISMCFYVLFLFMLSIRIYYVIRLFIHN